MWFFYYIVFNSGGLCFISQWLFFMTCRPLLYWASSHSTFNISHYSWSLLHLHCIQTQPVKCYTNSKDYSQEGKVQNFGWRSYFLWPFTILSKLLIVFRLCCFRKNLKCYYGNTYTHSQLWYKCKVQMLLPNTMYFSSLTVEKHILAPNQTFKLKQ
jgi:hypothetical protein